MRDLRKKIAVILSVIVCLSALSLAACASPDDCVIRVPDDYGKSITLSRYMDETGVRYTAAGGMVTSVNGVANAGGYYWMLYTDDEQNSDAAWGVIEFEGKTLYSATKGAEALTVKPGCIYVWKYLRPVF